MISGLSFRWVWEGPTLREQFEKELADYLAKIAKEFVNRMYVELRKVTPVKTGRLKAGWKVEVERVRKRNVTIAITNTQPYMRWIFFSPRSPHYGKYHKAFRNVERQFR